MLRKSRKLIRKINSLGVPQEVNLDVCDFGGSLDYLDRVGIRFNVLYSDAFRKCGNLTCTRPFFIDESSNRIYRKANEVATEVASHYRARDIKVSLTGRLF